MSFAKVQSAQLSGISARSVEVEVDISRGLYLFQIVGLPDKAVEESRERVLSALRNSLEINPKTENQKVIISLSPAEMKKEGAYFDIAIAVGYLLATGHISESVDNKLFIGELSLNGAVRGVRGLLPIALWAKRAGITELFIPKANEQEAALLEGFTIHIVESLAALVEHLKQTTLLPQVLHRPFVSSQHKGGVDFSHIKGQENAKRALQIAAAGGHNIVLYGPPGTGKSMLAKAFIGILPSLNNQEFIEVATIYSAAGLSENITTTTPPFRSPHHSASPAAVIGGGQQLRAGDITLAHRGVLYLDEFPEFDRRTIESLREPLEEGNITIARAKGSVRYPADFILLAAMNPCPCGYRGSTIKQCRCSGMELARYRKKLSGPIIDRIDMWVPVTHIAYESLHATATITESPALQKTITALRLTQHSRQKKLNTALSSYEIEKSVSLAPSAKEVLQQSARTLKLSPRVYLRIIKVSRTIADIEHSSTIEPRHILEALQYRPKFD